MARRSASEQRPPRAAGTVRLEAFTDGVIAIVVTLLVLELHVPSAEGEELSGALVALLPKLASLAVSFATVAIYWVNHHHFFERVRYTDWRVLWLNNHFLFWLSLIPFTTALVGDHIDQPVAVATYALNLMLTGGAFVVMGQYALFGGALVDESVPMAERWSERRRGWAGVSAFAVAVVMAYVWSPGALILIAGIPLAYFVPNLLSSEAEA